ncbi:MAG: carotenoid biosynthesis protein [Phaeodactylibacter sp.]|nr:carotenoid biosynthesis protein [Phaeodactylibacter sp.]MCB9301297.1 carotenoid biosynthesis protein [Lewinellaceae bacterium]
MEIAGIKLSPERGAVAILLILYAVGIVGITLPIHPDFVLLTPFNLLISLGLMLWNHPLWSRRVLWFIAIAYLIGFGAELFGVQTGLLFGDYTYGRVLGPKIWGTPLMIGVNWVMLGYAAGVAANFILPGRRWLARGGLAAGLMVALDVLIEPVAMQYGFWSWAGDVVPLRNYFGWFLVALPLECLFAAWLGGVFNKVAVALLILQFLFFLLLNILS